jgi:cytochrome oxidase assembly protein ShyY1
VLRTALWTLRQPRYAALAALMLALALICVAAGTWQISRFEQSVRDNDALDRNAHAAAVPLTTALVPIVNHGPAPGRDAIRFRTVTASGSYIADAQEFVREESLNGTSGYYVLNPLRTATGVLLVVRGFVADNGKSTPPATITAPPSRPVQITGRLQTTGTKDDAARELSDGEIESINPAEQTARLGAPVYATYVTLNANQPGTSGVTVLPDPDLSNPAGGAVEPQHFAYIVQWYLFALLALAAPFAMGRSEVREAQRRFLGIDPRNDELGIEPGSEQDPRLQLTAGMPSGGEVAIGNSGTVVRPGEPTAEQWQRAAQLADRYGRSLGLGHAAPADQAAPSARTGKAPPIDHEDTARNSAIRPHRSYDAFHGSYNDYLWQLALADGATTPTISVPEDESYVPGPRTPNTSTLQPDVNAPHASHELADEPPSTTTKGSTATRSPS